MITAYNPDVEDDNLRLRFGPTEVVKSYEIGESSVIP